MTLGQSEGVFRTKGYQVPSHPIKTMNKSTLSLKFPALCLAAGIALQSVSAQTWNGGGGDNNWTTAGNWGGTPPVAGNNLTFAGSTRPDPVNDFAAATNFGSIIFSAGAGAFTLTGNSINATGPVGITNNSSNLQTINLAGLPGAVARTITTNGGGGDISINSLTNGSLVKLGSGILTLGASGYGGTTTIGSSGGADGGTLRFTGNKSLSSSITVFAGTFDLNGNTATVPNAGNMINLGGGTAGTSAHLALGLGGVISFASGGTASLTTTASDIGHTVSGGTLNLTNGTRTFTVANGAAAIDLEVSSVIANGSGTGNLTKSNNGLLRLSGDNTYTGVTRVTGGGTLEFNSVADGGNSSALGASSNAAGNLQILNASGISYIGGNASTDRLIQVGDNTNADTITVSANGSGAIQFTNTGSLTYGTSGQTRTLVLSGSNEASNTLAAKIDNNGAGAIGVTKSGSGTWILSGADNTYTGATTVSAGTLLVNGNSNGSSAFTVADGATLGGIGSIAGSVTVNSGGILSPGQSTGLLSVGSLSLANGSFSGFELFSNTSRGTTFDAVNVTGSLAYGGTLVISLDTATAVIGDYDLFNFASQAGTFSAINFLTPGSAGTFNHSTGVLTVSAIPEPSAVAFLTLTLTAAVCFRRFRRKSSAAAV